MLESRLWEREKKFDSELRGGIVRDEKGLFGGFGEVWRTGSEGALSFSDDEGAARSEDEETDADFWFWHFERGGEIIERK